MNYYHHKSYICSFYICSFMLQGRNRPTLTWRSIGHQSYHTSLLPVGRLYMRLVVSFLAQVGVLTMISFTSKSMVVYFKISYYYFSLFIRIISPLSIYLRDSEWFRVQSLPEVFDLPSRTSTSSRRQVLDR